MFEARSCTALPRRGPAALAAFLPALALAALLGARPAAAQEWPPVKVYHSSDANGADLCPACPPGCTAGEGAGESVTINFDDLDTGETVTDQYAPQATFFANEGYDVITVSNADSPSHPNVIHSCQDGTYCYSGSVYVTFSPPVDNLSFWVGGDNSSSTTVVVTAWDQWGMPMGTVSVPLDGVYQTWHRVDLSDFAGVWRIHIYSTFDETGLFYDDFHWGAGYDCVIKGTANEQLDLWIDGGSSEADSEGTTCMMGEDGDTGNRLCGADILLEITGAGVFTHFQPVMDTLVQHPECEPNGGNGFCSLPPNTKKVRMNFRRGEGKPPAGPRKVASLLVDSGGSTEGSPTTVWLKGVAAASANLQMRPIAAGGPEKIAEGPIDMPEPGEILMLATGLFALAGLYRRRRRQ